jgi:flagellar protein FliO/FliZ
MKRSGKLLYNTSYTSRVTSFIGFLLLFAINIPLAVAESGESIKLPAAASAKQSVVSGESVFGVVFSLLLVIAVIFLLAWIMRRMGGTTPRSNALMKVIGGLSMGTRERVVLIQVGEEQLLLGVAPGRIQTLHVLEKPLQAADASDFSAASFADRLKSIVNKEK